MPWGLCLQANPPPPVGAHAMCLISCLKQGFSRRAERNASPHAGLNRIRPSSPAFGDAIRRSPVPLLPLRARFVSSASETQRPRSPSSSVDHFVCAGGIMGMRVVSPVAESVSQNHFHDVSLLLMGLRFRKSSSDSLGTLSVFLCPWGI